MVSQPPAIAELAPVAPVAAASDDNGVEVSDDQQARELIDLGDPYGDFMTIDGQSSDVLGALLMAEDMFRPPIWLANAEF